MKRQEVCFKQVDLNRYHILEYDEMLSINVGRGNIVVEPTLTPTQKIEDAIKTVGPKDYVIGKYQCDEYVNDVLKTAGYEPKDYYVDNPSGKKVDTHISELKNSGDNYETDVSKLDLGSYVVFMQDKEGVKGAHAALLVVEPDSKAYIMDNSSHNNPIYGTDENDESIIIGYKGGTDKTKGGNADTICSWYTGYENFYFQKIGE